MDLDGVELDLLLIGLDLKLLAVQIVGEPLQVLLGLHEAGHGVVVIRLGRQHLGAGILELVLGGAQGVARDDIFHIAQKHEEEQDQCHRAHHVGVGGPEALLAAALLRAGGIAPGAPHERPPLSRMRVTSRRPLTRSRTVTSMRSTVPRRL